MEKFQALLPYAEVFHVGGTAIENSLTKGDVDIQVRVSANQFQQAKLLLASVYNISYEIVQTDFYCAFETRRYDLSLRIHLTIVGSQKDIFWRITKVLNSNLYFRIEFTEMKLRYHGASGTSEKTRPILLVFENF